MPNEMVNFNVLCYLLIRPLFFIEVQFNWAIVSVVGGRERSVSYPLTQARYGVLVSRIIAKQHVFFAPLARCPRGELVINREVKRREIQSAQSVSDYFFAASVRQTAASPSRMKPG
jgi:hypothetical protein